MGRHYFGARRVNRVVGRDEQEAVDYLLGGALNTGGPYLPEDGCSGLECRKGTKPTEITRIEKALHDSLLCQFELA